MASLWAYILWISFFGSGLTRAVTYEGANWRTSYSFDHGYVLVWDDPVDNLIAHAATLALYAPDGHKLYSTPLKTTDGIAFSALSGAIDADGTVAVVYRCPQSHNGIALIDPAGKVSGLHSTDPYIPGYICFGKDGSLWTAGWPLSPVAADFLTIRKFSRGGAQTAAFLPVSEVTSLNEASYRHPFHQLIGGWRMRTAKDRLGAVAELKPLEWLELDLEGKLVGRWEMAETGMSVGGFTTSGAVYAQLAGTGQPPALLLLDKTSGKWNRTGAAFPGRLIAADGEDLVFKPSAVSQNLLIWVRMRAQWAPAKQ